MQLLKPTKLKGVNLYNRIRIKVYLDQFVYINKRGRVEFKDWNKCNVPCFITNSQVILIY